VQLVDIDRLIVEDLQNDVAPVEGNNGVKKGFFV
jgi:hypothetical protein